MGEVDYDVVVALVPTPRKSLTIRLPDELSRHLEQLAQEAGTSMNKVVEELVAGASGLPEFAPSAGVSDIQTPIARDACHFDGEAIGPLKGIARHLFNRGQIALAAVIWTSAARLVAANPDPERGGPIAASSELTHTAMTLEKANHRELAIWLLRQALRPELNRQNRTAKNLLGQWLVKSAQRDGDVEKYREAAELLSGLVEFDSHAQLFHGLATLELALYDNDGTLRDQSVDEIARALRRWAFGNPNTNERQAWLRQLRALSEKGADGAVDDLIAFANTEAGWERIRPEDLERR